MHKIGPMEDLLVARNLIVFKVYHDHFEYYVCTDQESMGAGGGADPSPRNTETWIHKVKFPKKNFAPVPQQ